MKKGFKITAATMIALSAITPVVAAAENTVQPGIYTSVGKGFYTASEFQNLSLAQKKAIVADSKAAFVSGSVVYNLLGDVLTKTDAQLNAITTTVAQYEATNGVKFNPGVGFGEAPVTGELKVESVSAINASQLLVKFSQEVDKATAETVANYLVNGTAGGTTLVTAAGAVKPAVLQSDKKSVLLTLNQTNVAYGKNKAIAVTVNGVELANDASKVISQYSTTVTLNDTVAPTLTAVEAKAATTTTTVTFKVSEPVVTTNAVFKINGTTISGSPVQSASNPLEYTVTSATPLVAGQTYTFEVYNLADTAAVTSPAASANLLTTTKQFTVVGQTTTGGLQTATATGDNKIEIVFADAVTKASVEAANNVKVLLADGTTLTNSTDFTVAQSATDAKKATINLTTTGAGKVFNNVTSANVTVIVTDAVKDSVGNSLPLKQQVVTLTKDSVGPKATSVRALKNTSGAITGFEVTYDSTLTVATPTTTGIRAINSNGTEITTNLGFATSTGAVVATASNKLTISLPSPVATSTNVSGTVRLILPEIATLTDDAYVPNKAQATTLNAVLDTTAPSNIAVTAVAAGSGDNVYTVTFSKATKVSDVLSNTNYKLNGETLPSDSLITYNSTTRVATIEVPNSFAKKDDSKGILTVSGIKSSTETETIATYYGEVVVKDKVAPELLSATLNADNTVTLTFSEALAAAPTVATGLEIKINNTTAVTTGTLAATAATGSDAGTGKYVINLGALVKYDSGSTSTYLDINNDGTKDANEPVFAASDITANATALASLLKTNSLVSSITVGTGSTVTFTDASGQTNAGKANTSIKVK